MSDVASRPEAAADGLERLVALTGATAGDIEAFQRYLGMLEQANRTMNLVGPSAFGDIWTRHILDSAQLFHVEQRAVWADVGSGAGFPGVVLAILLRRRAGGRIHLIESIAKRARFLAEVCAALDLPAEVHTGRAEAWRAPSDLDIVTARACAPLPRLLQFTAHLLRPGVVGLFLKGRDAEAEVISARHAWRFKASLTPSLSSQEGRIVRIEEVSRRAR